MSQVIICAVAKKPCLQLFQFTLFYIFNYRKSIQIFLELKNSNKKWKNSVKTPRDLTVLCAYVENQAKGEPILLYSA